MSNNADRYRRRHRKVRPQKQKRTKPRMEDHHITRARKFVQQLLSRGRLYGVNPKNAAHGIRLNDKQKRHLGPRPWQALTVAIEQLWRCKSVSHDGFSYSLAYA